VTLQELQCGLSARFARQGGSGWLLACDRSSFQVCHSAVCDLPSAHEEAPELCLVHRERLRLEIILLYRPRRDGRSVWPWKIQGSAEQPR
jgi:hypothetical protein